MSGSYHGSRYRGGFNQSRDAVPPRVTVTTISKTTTSHPIIEIMIRAGQSQARSADVVVTIDSVGKLIGIRLVAMAVEAATIILPVTLTEILLRNQEVDNQMPVA